MNKRNMLIRLRHSVLNSKSFSIRRNGGKLWPKYVHLHARRITQFSPFLGIFWGCSTGYE